MCAEIYIIYYVAVHSSLHTLKIYHTSIVGVQYMQRALKL